LYTDYILLAFNLIEFVVIIIDCFEKCLPIGAWGHVLFVCVSKRFSLYHNNNSADNLYGFRNFFNAPRIRITMRPPHRTNVTCKRFIEKAKQSRTKYLKEYLARPAGRGEVPVNQCHTKDIHKSHSSFPTIVYNIIRIPRRNRIYFYR